VRPILEAAVETVADARAAEAAGASRVELCVNLAAGGVTPPADLLRAVVERVSIPVFVMIRPRPGDFVYSEQEIILARRAVAMAVAGGASGIVLGVLRPDRSVDVERTHALIVAAGGLPATFHRAFDATRDLRESLERVAEAGVTRVLTSGGAATAVEGAVRLTSLVRQARGRLTVVAGGDVRAHNVVNLIAETGVREVHARFETEEQTRRLVDLL
jgi:copper homeostasis protein